MQRKPGLVLEYVRRRPAPFGPVTPGVNSQAATGVLGWPCEYHNAVRTTLTASQAFISMG